VLAVATAFIAFMYGYGEVGWFPVTMFMAMIFAVATGVSFNLLWFPRKMRRLFAQQPLYGNEMESAWSDREFSTRSALGATVVQWEQFVRWKEASKSFLFYLSDASYLFVPKRALDGDQLLDPRRCAEAGITMTGRGIALKSSEPTNLRLLRNDLWRLDSRPQSWQRRLV